MHVRTMQALVVVFPEYLPITLNGPEEDVTDDQLSERPCVEPIQRYIEVLFKRGWFVGQCNEDESIPFPHTDLVEREIRHVETARVSLGGGPQQVPLQVVNPRVVRTDDGAGTH